jgi:hypothetical protein
MPEREEPYPRALFPDVESCIREDLDEVVDLVYQAVQDKSLLINEQFETKHAGLIFSHVEQVAAILAGDDNDDPGVAEVAYKALHFAYAVSHETLRGKHGPIIYVIGHADGVDSWREYRDRLVKEGYKYLEEHELIGRLIDQYMPLMDPSGQYPEIASVVAATTFMFIDRGQEHLTQTTQEREEKQAAIEREVAAGVKALDAWDKGIPWPK